MIEQIDAFAPDLVLLAGFMRILTATFVTHFHGRLLNIHPSLLPKYKGLQTHQRALDAGDAEAGASIHFVTENWTVAHWCSRGEWSSHPDDYADSLATRVQQQKPACIRWWYAGSPAADCA
ncbi:formyltransferase family protein [Halopseudomonas pachastrellae]|nr:formyltransferase family protein [Halopseudomonas pachastrellae]